MSPSTAALLMRVTGGISLVVAVLFALAGVNDFTGLNDVFFKLASSGGEGVSGLNTLEAKMAMAIAGGVFAGLAAYYLFIGAPGVEQQNEMIRKGSIYALLTWYIVDSAASAASGNTPNVIPNTVFLALYLAPLLLVKFDKA